MNKSFQYHDEQFVILGRVWSDFAAHIPLIRSFSMGNNFPPEYPTFPSEPIRYHYLFFLIVGLLETIGFNIAFALNLMSALGMFLLLEMIYLYGWKIFSSRKIGILAVLLFLFNGTFSIWEFIKISNTPPELINRITTAKEYASFGPWDGHIVSAFWNWNIYINQRHLAMSYGLALLGMFPLLWYSKINHKKSLFQKIKDFFLKKQKIEIISTKFERILNFKKIKSKIDSLEPISQNPNSTFLKNLTTHYSLLTTSHSLSPITYYLLPLFALFPLLHQASWIMLCGFSAFWMTTHFRVLPKKLIALYIFSMTASVLVATFFTQTSQQALVFQIGYLAQDHTVFGLLKYWFFNLGLYILLVPLIFVFGDKNKKLFLFPFLVFFLIANFFRLSPDMINNHKLINFAMIGWNILVASALVNLVKKFQWSLIIAIPLIFGLTLSGIADVFPIINNHYHYIDDYPLNETSTWIKTYTLPKSIFLTNTYLYNPAQLVGRKTFLDYGYFNWSMGYPDGERRQLLSKIFSADDTIAGICQTLKANQIDYILIDPSNTDPHPGVQYIDSVIHTQFTKQFESSDGWVIYNIQVECLATLPTVPTK